MSSETRSLAKHTPGPWRAEVWGRGNDWKVVDARGRMITATIHKERACLVSAAPELLEAGNAVMEAIYLSHNGESIVEATNSLAAAIEKAEGRE